MSDIFEQVVKVLKDNRYTHVDTITPSHQLTADLGLDSLDEVEFAMSLEEHFEMNLPDEMIEKWKCVDDVVTTITALKAQPQQTRIEEVLAEHLRK